MQLLVSCRNVYGQNLVYPECNKAKALCSLTGKKTLGDHHIETLKELGYTFMIVNPQWVLFHDRRLSRNAVMKTLNIGDRVIMRDCDVIIIVSGISKIQPEEDNGIFSIVDQYGETHKVELNEHNRWEVIIEGIL